MNVLATRGVQSEARLAFGGLAAVAAAGALASERDWLRRTRPRSTRRSAWAMTNLRSTFVSPWPSSTCCRTRPPIAPCCWSPRTPIGLTSPRWMSSASSREGWNQIRSFCWRRLARATRTLFGAGELPELRLQPLDPESADSASRRQRGSFVRGQTAARILREAAGNPLALAELPSIADRLDDKP